MSLRQGQGSFCPPLTGVCPAAASTPPGTGSSATREHPFSSRATRVSVPSPEPSALSSAREPDRGLAAGLRCLWPRAPALGGRRPRVAVGVGTSPQPPTVVVLREAVLTSLQERVRDGSVLTAQAHGRRWGQAPQPSEPTWSSGRSFPVSRNLRWTAGPGLFRLLTPHH